MVRPTISVIVATYNAQHDIERAIHSVLAQTYSEFELIVVDDCSSDQTVSVVKRISDDRIKCYLNSSNDGPSYSRNRAIGLAQGKWIAILDADDWWDPQRLEVLLDTALEHQVQIVCDNLHLIRDGEDKPFTSYLQSRESVIGTIPDGYLVDALKMIQEDYGYLKPFISSDFVRDKQVSYAGEQRVGEDFRFLLECLLAGGQMVIITTPYYYYTIRMGSLSNQSNAGKLFQVQLRQIDQLTLRYRDRSDVVVALAKYRLKKQAALTHQQFRQELQEGKLIQSFVRMTREPRLIRSLLRVLYYKVMRKTNKQVGLK